MVVSEICCRNTVIGSIRNSVLIEHSRVDYSAEKVKEKEDRRQKRSEIKAKKSEAVSIGFVQCI